MKKQQVYIALDTDAVTGEFIVRMFAVDSQGYRIEHILLGPNPSNGRSNNILLQELDKEKAEEVLMLIRDHGRANPKVSVSKRNSGYQIVLWFEYDYTGEVYGAMLVGKAIEAKHVTSEELYVSCVECIKEFCNIVLNQKD